MPAVLVEKAAAVVFSVLSVATDLPVLVERAAAVVFSVSLVATDLLVERAAAVVNIGATDVSLRRMVRM